MKTKTQFICIKPKTQEAKEFFNLSMRQLHTCKVIDKNEDNVLLNSIAGNFKFWMNLKEDMNWEVVK